jgi:hypothetical protein
LPPGSVTFAVAVLGEQVQQDLVTGSFVGDVALRQQLAGLVDQGDIVGPFGPVDSAVDQFVLPLARLLRWSRAHAGHAAT